MRARPMSIVAGVLLALALASLGTAWWAARPRIEGAAFSAREVGTASEVQRRMLADGVVTRDEVTEAYEADRRCLEDAGYSPDPLTFGADGPGFSVQLETPVDVDSEEYVATFETTWAACDAEHVTLVGRAWLAQKH